MYYWPICLLICFPISCKLLFLPVSSCCIGTDPEERASGRERLALSQLDWMGFHILYAMCVSQYIVRAYAAPVKPTHMCNRCNSNIAWWMAENVSCVSVRISVWQPTYACKSDSLIVSRKCHHLMSRRCCASLYSLDLLTLFLQSKTKQTSFKWRRLFP